MSEAKTRPTIEQQKDLDDVLENSFEEVSIVGSNKKYNVGWLKRGAIRKISHIMSSNDSVNDDKISCKISSCIILNGYWSIKLFYWILWRWLYYVKQYGDEQLKPLIEVGKKKVPQIAYYETTISMIGMKDTIMTMTKKEVERFRQELSGEQHTH